MLEAENLKIALNRYKGHPVSALLLAHQLMAIKQRLQHGPKAIPDAIAGLDLAIETLYPHTDFHKVSYKLYQRRLKGIIKPDQEEKLRGTRNKAMIQIHNSTEMLSRQRSLASLARP